MKTTKTLLLSIALFTAFSLQSQVFDYINYKLIPIPTYPTTEPITVFYENEQPSKPYFKLAILDDYVQHSKGSFSELIQKLKTEAQNIGADAIIIHKMGTSTRDALDIEGYQVSISVKEVIAFGIKYKENLTYLSTIPKAVSIYEASDSTGKIIKNGNFTQDWNGEILDVNGNVDLLKLLQPFSLNHLVLEEKNWQYSLNNNLVNARQLLDKQNNKIKAIYLFYDAKQRIETIDIRKVENTERGNKIIFNQKVNIKYDENGFMYLKRIYPNLQQVDFYYETVFKYDVTGKLSEKKIFQVKNKVRTELGKFVYETYYSVEDLIKTFPELNRGF